MADLFAFLLNLAHGERGDGPNLWAADRFLDDAPRVNRGADEAWIVWDGELDTALAIGVEGGREGTIRKAHRQERGGREVKAPVLAKDETTGVVKGGGQEQGAGASGTGGDEDIRLEDGAWGDGLWEGEGALAVDEPCSWHGCRV